MFLRIIKRLLSRSWRVIGRHKLGTLVVLPLLLALSYVNLFGVPELFGRPAPVSARRPNQALPPAAATEVFVRGEMTFSADLMLAPLSDGLRANMEKQGMDRDSLQSRLNVEKDKGARARMAYIGAVPLDDGTVEYFYALLPVSRGRATFHVFTVDPDGKISKVG